VELAIRTAMLGLGGSLLERLLAADTGHRGPRTDCGAGHQAGFVGYRDKTIDTVLGPVQVRRAYYHCADCGHGAVPRDDELGVPARRCRLGWPRWWTERAPPPRSPRPAACWATWPGSR
jgi:hypothetical protein